uniref:Uncharacterized protein n=1 Tax=Sphaerodactylus townsendi TaxID=933632 RepID=A0ACB8G0M0_9SAUR
MRIRQQLRVKPRDEGGAAGRRFWTPIRVDALDRPASTVLKQSGSRAPQSRAPSRFGSAIKCLHGNGLDSQCPPSNLQGRFRLARRRVNVLAPDPAAASGPSAAGRSANSGRARRGAQLTACPRSASPRPGTQPSLLQRCGRSIPRHRLTPE